MLKLLEWNPFHPSLRLHKLKAPPPANLHSASINRSFRITLEFLIEGDTLIPVDVGDHDSAQRQRGDCLAPAPVPCSASTMDILRSPDDMQRTALDLRAEGRRIGFVPTMGYLHEGHRSLMRIARARADTVVVSLFVNPTQFGPQEDLSRYPRDFEGDRAACEAEGVDILFAPDAADMYPEDSSVAVTDRAVTRRLEGASRPGHFDGVLTVVAKLFNLVLPAFAVFGRKDAQQLAAVEQMVRDLNFPVEIVAAPTVREPDGLAMSSRNVYLSPEQRRHATCLRRALDEARRRYAAGERDPGPVAAAMRSLIAATPGASLDYAELVHRRRFEPVERLDADTLAVLAVRFGSTRLIDNDLLA